MAEGALWTAAEAQAATGGKAVGAWRARGVSIDSRSLRPGDLFVALQGARDGHAFVADALARGAAAAVVAERPLGLPAEAPLLIVPDTLAALHALGAAARARSRARLVAVTGSVGKTGTKEALWRALARSGLTHASAASHNNLYGVPLSLARLPAQAAYGVFEIGMNHAGEITPLVRLVRPHVAIITNVEAVHLEFFSSVEAIADAKAEIFAGLEPGGVAVLNRDNPQFDRLRAHAEAQGVGRIIGFGEHREAEARLIRASLLADHSLVAAEICGQPMTYRLGIPGRHWVINSLAVLAAVAALGGDLAAAAAALADLTALSGRGARHDLALAGGTALLIDESYNASPPAMRAALAALAATPIGPQGRRIAVLGDMLELGAQAPQLHRALAEDVVRLGIDLVFAAGPQMRALFTALPASCRACHAETSTGLVGPVREALRPGDAIMVKGSLGSRMAVIVDALLGRTRTEAANG